MEQDRRQALAVRAGVETEYVDRLVELGILNDRVTGAGSDREDVTGNVRRIRVIEGLEAGGIPLPVLAEALRTGQLSLEFVDQPSYDRFAGDAAETFRQLADRTGIPVELLLVVREATGSAQPDPDSHLRENELRIIPYARDPPRGRDQDDLDRTDPAGRRRRLSPDGRDRVGLVADRDPRAAVPVRHPGRGGRHADRALRDGDRPDHRRRDARALPRAAGARLDAQHLRGVRGRPGPGRSARAVSSVRRRSASSTSRATAG